jgi:hypothetical protein
MKITIRENIPYLWNVTQFILVEAHKHLGGIYTKHVASKKATHPI